MRDIKQAFRKFRSMLNKYKQISISNSKNLDRGLSMLQVFLIKRNQLSEKLTIFI